MSLILQIKLKDKAGKQWLEVIWSQSQTGTPVSDYSVPSRLGMPLPRSGVGGAGQDSRKPRSF